MVEFWKKQSIKNYLVQDLYDVDEIVKRFGGCPNDEDYKIERSYYYIEFVGGEEPYEINTTTKEDYEKNKDIDSNEFDYRTKLNYDDFIDKFWLDSFQDVLFNYVEPDEQDEFITSVNETFFGLNFEGQGKMFLRDIISKLNQLIGNWEFSLHIKDKDYGTKINLIQEDVIKFYSQSYLNCKKRIIQHYEFIYPDIIDEFNPKGIEINTKLTREELLEKLIGDNKNKTVFKNYEKKLINQKYLTNDYEWNNKPANLARFYLYCIKKML